jgi:hypothetical protein
MKNEKCRAEQPHHTHSAFPSHTKHHAHPLVQRVFTKRMRTNPQSSQQEELISVREHAGARTPRLSRLCAKHARTCTTSHISIDSAAEIIRRIAHTVYTQLIPREDQPWEIDLEGNGASQVLIQSKLSGWCLSKKSLLGATSTNHLPSKKICPSHLRL